MKEDNYINILDAIETLSSIADYDITSDELDLYDEHSMNLEASNIRYRAIHWMREKNPDKTIATIRDLFRSILHYLEELYLEKGEVQGGEVYEEGIKNIMTLVGEATHKLDNKCSHLFKGISAVNIRQLKEYSQLRDFYLSKIASGGQEVVATYHTWEKKYEASISTEEKERVIIEDLEAVKRDLEYELFYLKKENGEPFYTKDLVRNIKLACDFNVGVFHGDDPLLQVKSWQDKSLQISAKQIIASVKHVTAAFYRDAMKHKEREVVSLLNKTMLALMLSANPRNLLRNFSAKSCYQYFLDFQCFLRETVSSREYQTLLAFPPTTPDRFSYCIIHLIHSLCRALYTHNHDKVEMMSVIEDLIAKGNELAEKKQQAFFPLWKRLSRDYDAIAEVLQHHPSGPLFKAMDLLNPREGKLFFDPTIQENTPHFLYALSYGQKSVSCLHIPSPTVQSIINKAEIIGEFKGFLRGYIQESFDKRHLFFNLQDRTSLREHARVQEIEELQTQAEFSSCLTVVTLAKNSDFYYQTSHFLSLDNFVTFKEQLIENLSSKECGFYYPKAVYDVLFPRFIEQIIDAVHALFFQKKKDLSRRERLDFIEIIYTLMQLKVMDFLSPESISFSCKDSIDVGGTASLQLYFFLHLINGRKIGKESLEKGYEMFYGKALIIRERSIIPEHFQRFVNYIKTIETAIRSHGKEDFSSLVYKELAPLFDNDVLSAVTG
ncbi:hypothetical protein JYU14_00285 [Simkania negevensis]|uniref:Uncharacterized protein n=1 Tax=Simkania negevensis TaxID=83561 RepID=A0ABS3ASN1_9BACT|nr:hypothetical protein [Simkania negevensis]